jgi:hypothetical protein
MSGQTGSDQPGDASDDVSVMQDALERRGWVGASGPSWVDHHLTNADEVELHAQLIPGSGVLMVSAEGEDEVFRYDIGVGTDPAAVVDAVTTAADVVEDPLEFERRLRPASDRVEVHRATIEWEDDDDGDEDEDG